MQQRRIATKLANHTTSYATGKIYVCKNLGFEKKVSQLSCPQTTCCYLSRSLLYPDMLPICPQSNKISSLLDNYHIYHILLENIFPQQDNPPIPRQSLPHLKTRGSPWLYQSSISVQKQICILCCIGLDVLY